MVLEVLGLGSIFLAVRLIASRNISILSTCGKHIDRVCTGSRCTGGLLAGGFITEVEFACGGNRCVSGGMVGSSGMFGEVANSDVSETFILLPPWLICEGFTLFWVIVASISLMLS